MGCVPQIDPDVGLIGSTAFSHKDDLIAVGGRGCAEIFQAATGQRRAIFMLNDRSKCRSLGFSIDDTVLMTGCDSGIVSIWDLQTGGLVSTLKGHTGSILSVAFSPCGTMVASGSEDSTIRIWNVSSHDCRYILEGHLDEVQNVSWLGTGRQVISCSNSSAGIAKLWDISEARCLKTFEFTQRITALSSGQDHSHFALSFWDPAWATRNGAIKVIDAWTDDSQTISINGCVSSIRFLSQDIVMYADDSTVFIHDLTNNASLFMFKYEGFAPAISSDGSCIVTYSCSAVMVWQTDCPSPNPDLARHDESVTCVAFSGDGQLIASGSMDWTVKVWEATSGRCLDTFEMDIDVSSLAFSPDSTLLAYQTEFAILIRRIPIRSHILTPTIAVESPSTGITFSPDSRNLVSLVSRNHPDPPADSTLLKLWEVATGKCLASIELDDDFHKVTFGLGGNSVTLDSWGIWKTRKRWTISPTTYDLSIDNDDDYDDKSPLLMTFDPVHDTQQPTSPDLLSIQAHYEPMGEWILDYEGRRVCWVMPDLRSYAHDIHGEKVVIGSFSGRVIIVDISDVY